jgi:hypothetical protein
VSAPATKKIQSKKIVTLADGYHLIFDDWDEAVRWQGGVLDSILRAKTGMEHLSISISSAEPADTRAQSGERRMIYILAEVDFEDLPKSSASSRPGDRDVQEAWQPE